MNRQQTSNYLYLPSVLEINPSQTLAFNSFMVPYELEIDPELSGYPLFSNNTDRCKSLQGSYTPYGYWTRSPYYMSSATTNNALCYHYGVAPADADPDNWGGPGATTQLYYPDGTTTPNYFRRDASANSQGVAVCFSI